MKVKGRRKGKLERIDQSSTLLRLSKEKMTFDFFR